MSRKKIIYTIGHSTHTTREFIKILKSFDIELLADVRHYPGSRYCPQFNKSRLKRNLLRNQIEYLHLEELGGRRRVDKNSNVNAGWRSPQFRGYADYMQTPEFSAALSELIALSKKKRVAIMCAEALPWRCHRSMIADALVVRGVEVFDIFAIEKVKAHELSAFAKVEKKKITYPEY